MNKKISKKYFSWLKVHKLQFTQMNKFFESVRKNLTYCTWKHWCTRLQCSF